MSPEGLWSRNPEIRPCFVVDKPTRFYATNGKRPPLAFAAAAIVWCGGSRTPTSDLADHVLGVAEHMIEHRCRSSRHLDLRRCARTIGSAPTLAIAPTSWAFPRGDATSFNPRPTGSRRAAQTGPRPPHVTPGLRHSRRWRWSFAALNGLPAATATPRRPLRAARARHDRPHRRLPRLRARGPAQA